MLTREWDNTKTITIIEFNTLADGLEDNFRNPKKIDLSFDNRKEMLIEEITRHSASVICLAECNNFDTFWKPRLCEHGYEGIHNPKDHALKYGVAIFYKKDEFSPGCYLDSEEPNGLIVTMMHLKSQRLFSFAMVHLKAKPGNESRRLEQITLFGKHLENMEHPVIFCGDFNAEYDENCVKHVKDVLKLENSYTECEFTTFKIRETVVKHTIDYIFHSKELKVISTLNIPKVDADGLPNERYPSDHVAIGAKFLLPN